MLLFNPYFRITVEDAIEHPFFSRVREHCRKNQDPGFMNTVAKEPISIEFDLSGEVLDKKRLRRLFLEEIKSLKAEQKK